MSVLLLLSVRGKYFMPLVIYGNVRIYTFNKKKIRNSIPQSIPYFSKQEPAVSTKSSLMMEPAQMNLSAIWMLTTNGQSLISACMPSNLLVSTFFSVSEIIKLFVKKRKSRFKEPIVNLVNV